MGNKLEVGEWIAICWECNVERDGRNCIYGAILKHNPGDECYDEPELIYAGGVKGYNYSSG